MVIRINPSRMPLWRSPTEMQFGSGPNALRIESVSRAQERLIHLLLRGMPNGLVREMADTLGVQEHEKLISALEPALMDYRFAHVDADFVAKQFAEICRVQSTHNFNGEAVIAGRKLRRVFVSEPHDLLQNALSNSGVGEVRSDNFLQFDFAILIAHHAVSPQSYSPWLSAAVPHVAIIYNADGVVVTPVIERGKTPCLNCFHQEQSKLDSAWPELASQMLFSKQRFDDSTSQLFGSAIACQRALETLDALSDFEVRDRNRMGYRLSFSSGTVSEFAWGYASECLCQQG